MKDNVHGGTQLSVGRKAVSHCFAFHAADQVGTIKAQR